MGTCRSFGMVRREGGREGGFPFGGWGREVTTRAAMLFATESGRGIDKYICPMTRAVNENKSYQGIMIQQPPFYF